MDKIQNLKNDGDAGHYDWIFRNIKTELKPSSYTMAMLRLGLVRIKETKSNKRPISVADLAGSKLNLKWFLIKNLLFKILIL